MPEVRTFDRTSDSVGTGNFTFNEDVSAYLRTGDEFYVIIHFTQTVVWNEGEDQREDMYIEQCEATYLGNGVFSRGAIRMSSNENARVDFPAGTKIVDVKISASESIRNAQGVTISNNQVSVGATLVVNTSSIFIGNSIVNAVANSISFNIANSTVSSNVGIGTLQLGNSTVNAVVNTAALRIGNSSVFISANTSWISCPNGVISFGTTYTDRMIRLYDPGGGLGDYGLGLASNTLRVNYGGFVSFGKYGASYTEKVSIGDGLVAGSPTGGDKGAGTLNASNVYDDNVLLTCMALSEEFLNTGKINVEEWDKKAPKLHETARLFSDILEAGFDPRDPKQYIEKLKTDHALPGMPTEAEWRHNTLSSGQMINRLWLAMEMLALTVIDLQKKLEEKTSG